MLSASELIIVVLAVAMLCLMAIGALAGVLARFRRGRVEDPPLPPRGRRWRRPGIGRR